MHEKCGHSMDNRNKLKWIIGTHGNWKNQNPGGRFGATSQTARPIWPIHHKNGPNGLNWQCCLAGSSKTAPRILIFSTAMDADYSFELISIAHWVPAFFMHNNSVLARVSWPQLPQLQLGVYSKILGLWFFLIFKVKKSAILIFKFSAVMS